MNEETKGLPVVANPSGELAERLIAQLIESGAENYLESHFDLTIDGSQPYSVMVLINFPGKPSPHEFRRKAEESLAQRDAELAELREQNECLRMQLVACGVVALANTPDSAAKARDMNPDYWSASCGDVVRAVDAEMAIRAERAALQAELAAMRDQKPVAYCSPDSLLRLKAKQFNGMMVYTDGRDTPGTVPLYAVPVSAPRTPAEWSAAGCKCVRYGVGNPHWPCPLHPIPAPVQVAAEVVQVPRETLRRAFGWDCSPDLADVSEAMGELRALLATSQEQAE